MRVLFSVLLSSLLVVQLACDRKESAKSEPAAGPYAGGKQMQPPLPVMRSIGKNAPTATAEPPATKPAGMARSIYSAQYSDPLDREAVDLALDHFAKHWSRYGDTYLTYVSSRKQGGNPNDDCYQQRKGIRPVVERHPLTEADQLNGLSWKGRVYFNEAAEREYYFREAPRMFRPSTKKGWNDWTTWDASMFGVGVWRLQLERKDGVWKLTADGFDDEQYLTVDCDKDGKVPYEPVIRSEGER
jgi:hypothetical protein